MMLQKVLNVLAIGLKIPHNYFDNLNKIIFGFVSKFLDTSTKSFFPSTSTVL